MAKRSSCAAIVEGRGGGGCGIVSSGIVSSIVSSNFNESPACLGLSSCNSCFVSFFLAGAIGPGKVYLLAGLVSCIDTRGLRSIFGEMPCALPVAGLSTGANLAGVCLAMWRSSVLRVCGDEENDGRGWL